jgi:hypothetical protein
LNRVFLALDPLVRFLEAESAIYPRPKRKTWLFMVWDFGNSLGKVRQLIFWYFSQKGHHCSAVKQHDLTIFK